MLCLFHFDFSDQMQPSPELWTTKPPHSPSPNHPDQTYQEFLLPIHQVLLFAIFQGNLSELGLRNKYLAISAFTFLTDVSAHIVQYYFGVLIVRLISLFEENYLK